MEKSQGNLGFEYDKVTDVMFVDLHKTNNPVDTIPGPDDILIRIDLKTGEVVSLQINNWKSFRRRMFFYYGAYTTKQAIRKVIQPILIAAKSISDYYKSQWLHPVLPNCN